MADQDNQNTNPGSESPEENANPSANLAENSEASPASTRTVDFLFDIPLELTVEVGRCSMPMGELINIMPGDIVELNTPAGEKLNILANGKLVAKGEAVLVGERYGVRVLEIVEKNSFKKALPGSNGGTA